MAEDRISLLYSLFANLLEYPTPALAQQAKACYEALMADQPQAAKKMEEFQGFVEKANLQQVEELYTSTFDMQPVCYPYVGFQLFGESYKRGAFMARLNEGYRSYGYQVARELPDHISVILRFLALRDEVRLGEFGQVLLCEGLVPAVSKMAGAFTKSSAVCSADLSVVCNADLSVVCNADLSVAPNPYATLIYTLHIVLTGETEKEMKHA